MASSSQNRRELEVIQEISRVLDQAGIFVGVEVRDGRLQLDGQVDSVENRDAALDVARAVGAPLDMPIQDNIEILTIVPDDVWPEADTADDDFAYAENPEAARLDPDFSADPGTVDPDLSDEGVPFFPPTDPVVEPSNDEEQLAVVGGFQSTSMDEDPTDPERRFPGDGQLEDMIERELREDALTTELQIEVDVRNGVVTLRGEVERMDDALNAEAVAARVEGVQEVREQLSVKSINRQSAR
jgi:osmotically-inducible protein OsmY